MRRSVDDGKRPGIISMIATWGMGFAMGLAAVTITSGLADERVPTLRLQRADTVPPRAQADVAGEPAPTGCREDEAAWSAALDGLTANLRLAAEVADLESALDALRHGALDGPSFVRSAVQSMPEDEIEDILAATTKLDAAHLEGIEDIQGYAVRLADIAMEGVLAEESEPAGSAEVVFSTRQEGRRADWQTAETFDVEDDRVYAFFDTTGWPNGDVMVRWRHVDTGEVLLLEQHRVRANSARGFVWARPSRGWQPGVYQVDVYAGDEGLGHLASGRYAVN
jgi:hypothetical protein